MIHKISPVAARKRVLRAFLFPKVGAVISQKVVEEYFRRRSLPLSIMNLGVQYATQANWIAISDLQTFVLQEAGMDEVAKPPVIPGMPQAVWQSWAHR